MRLDRFAVHIRTNFLHTTPQKEQAQYLIPIKVKKFLHADEHKPPLIPNRHFNCDYPCDA